MRSSTLWDITLTSPLKDNRRFGGKCRLHLQKSSACYLLHIGFLLRVFFDPEDEGEMFLRWLSTGYTALYPRIWDSSKMSWFYKRRTYKAVFHVSRNLRRLSRWNLFSVAGATLYKIWGTVDVTQDSSKVSVSQTGNRAVLAACRFQIEALLPFETLVTFYQNMLRNIPDNITAQIHRCENLDLQ
jgi:hypothetical protein